MSYYALHFLLGFSAKTEHVDWFFRRSTYIESVIYIILLTSFPLGILGYDQVHSLSLQVVPTCMHVLAIIFISNFTSIIIMFMVLIIQYWFAFTRWFLTCSPCWLTCQRTAAWPRWTPTTSPSALPPTSAPFRRAMTRCSSPTRWMNSNFAFNLGFQNII